MMPQILAYGAFALVAALSAWSIVRTIRQEGERALANLRELARLEAEDQAAEWCDGFAPEHRSRERSK